MGNRQARKEEIHEKSSATGPLTAIKRSRTGPSSSAIMAHFLTAAKSRSRFRVPGKVEVVAGLSLEGRLQPERTAFGGREVKSRLMIG